MTLELLIMAVIRTRVELDVDVHHVVDRGVDGRKNKMSWDIGRLQLYHPCARHVPQPGLFNG